jgi:hypothetical protein
MNVLAEGGNTLAGQIAIGVLVALAAAGLIAFYWLPTIIGRRRHVPALSQVVVVNLLLGWTLIGWAVALVLSLREIAPAATRGSGG